MSNLVKWMMLGACGALLVGCAEPTAEAAGGPEWRTLSTAEEFAAAVVGRPLAYDNGLKLVLTPDGGFESSNQQVGGRWEWVGAQYCREITIAGRSFPYECHGAQISADGKRFRGVNADGSGRSAATVEG